MVGLLGTCPCGARVLHGGSGLAEVTRDPRQQSRQPARRKEQIASLGQVLMSSLEEIECGPCQSRGLRKDRDRWLREVLLSQSPGFYLETVNSHWSHVGGLHPCNKGGRPVGGFAD